jgi:hypothetical protein
MKTDKVIQVIFQSVIVLCFFGVVYVLLTRVIPTENQRIVDLVIGALVGSYLTVVNYSFSSSAGSDKKTDIISKLPPLKEEEKPKE